MPRSLRAYDKRRKGILFGYPGVEKMDSEGAGIGSLANNCDALRFDTILTLWHAGRVVEKNRLPETIFRIQLAEDELRSQGNCDCVMSHTVRHAEDDFRQAVQQLLLRGFMSRLRRSQRVCGSFGNADVGCWGPF